MQESVQNLNRRLGYFLSEIDSVYHEIASFFGLSDSIMMVLNVLADGDGSCRLATLYQRTGLPKQTVNSALRRLESQKHVELTPADGKSKIVCLTASGQALAGRTVVQLAELENAIFARWPQEDLERYVGLTERYLRELREKTKELEEEKP